MLIKRKIEKDLERFYESGGKYALGKWVRPTLSSVLPNGIMMFSSKWILSP